MKEAEDEEGLMLKQAAAMSRANPIDGSDCEQTIEPMKAKFQPFLCSGMDKVFRLRQSTHAFVPLPFGAP